MSPETATSLRLTRTFEVDPEVLFRAWTDPDRMRRWMCPEGAVVEDLAADPVVGGAYRIVMRTGDGEQHTAVGEYREIDRPRRLVFTWGWEEEAASVEPGGSLVTVEFDERDGSTELVLTHERLPDAESREGHRQGWESSLTNLEKLVG